jgi:predicted amidohydrolase
MPIVRIAVANIRFPPMPEESVALASNATRQAALERADMICFSECYEGFRYPKTVRRAAQGGAHLVFHPHLSEAERDDYRPSSYADPANSFHEKSILCRAAENTSFVVTAKCASPGSPTTSAVAKPDGTLLSYQPYGKEGLLVADIDLTEATGLLASRYKPTCP